MSQKVLIIEDDKDASLLLKNFLKKLGYAPDSIVSCNSIAEMDALDNNDVEVIITDLTLPDSSPTETVKHVKNRFPNTPTIVLTATASDEFAIAAFHQGVQDYLLKTELNLISLKKSIHYSIERNKIRNDYKKLFQENPAPMFIFDDDTLKFVEVNTAALRQYGYTREEFLDLSVSDIRPKEDVALFFEDWEQSSDNFHYAGVWRHKNKQGEAFYVNITSHKSTLNNKTVKVVLALNIDENVKAERALQEKNREIQDIFESITDGFYAIDKDWKFKYINKEGEVLLNKMTEDIIDKNVWEVFPEAVGLKFYHEYHRSMTENISVHFEEYFPPLKRWFFVNAYPGKNGLSVYFIDITEWKQMQEKLLRNKQNLKAIINNTSDLIWSIDKNLNIITANAPFWKRVERLTGKGPKEIKEEDFNRSFLHTWREQFERAFKGETFKIVSEQVLDGEKIYDETSFHPIYDEHNDVIGISCFARDITQQYIHMQTIEEQNKKLTRIAWRQSHEVRRPVANILGLVDLFNTENLNDPNNAEIIRHLKDAAKMMDTTIRQITADTIDSEEIL